MVLASAMSRDGFPDVAVVRGEARLHNDDVSICGSLCAEGVDVSPGALSVSGFEQCFCEMDMRGIGYRAIADAIRDRQRFFEQRDGIAPALACHLYLGLQRLWPRLHGVPCRCRGRTAVVHWR